MLHFSFFALRRADYYISIIMIICLYLPRGCAGGCCFGVVLPSPMAVETGPVGKSNLAFWTQHLALGGSMLQLKVVLKFLSEVESTVAASDGAEVLDLRLVSRVIGR